MFNDWEIKGDDSNTTGGSNGDSAIFGFSVEEE